MQFTLHVNDRNYTVDVDNDTPLLWVLRDEIDLNAAAIALAIAIGLAVGPDAKCPVQFN